VSPAVIAIVIVVVLFIVVPLALARILRGD
jgi:hypothetical protein